MARSKTMGFGISLAQSYELLAAANNYANWPTLKSSEQFHGLQEAETAVQENALVSLALENCGGIVESHININSADSFLSNRRVSLSIDRTVLVFHGNSEDRLSAAKQFAETLGKPFMAVHPLDLLYRVPANAILKKIEEAFSQAHEIGAVLYIDDIERFRIDFMPIGGQPSLPGAGRLLCACVNMMSEEQILILGANFAWIEGERGSKVAVTRFSMMLEIDWTVKFDVTLPWKPRKPYDGYTVTYRGPHQKLETAEAAEGNSPRLIHIPTGLKQERQGRSSVA
jgi:hypothetical protein